MKKVRNSVLKNTHCLYLIGVIVLISLSLVSCSGGGGGGGDGGAVPTTEQGTIDSSTAPRTASAVANVTIGVEAAIFPITLDIGSGAYCPKTLLRHADDLIFGGGGHQGSALPGSDVERQAMGSSSETAPCSDGGSATLTITWDGPDSPADCSEVRNPRLEFTFANCQEGPETANGVASMYYQGDLCTLTPPALGMSFTNYRYKNPVIDSDLTLDLAMDFTNIHYDEDDKIVGVTLSVDGFMSGTFEGIYVDLDYDNWALELSNLEYDASNDIVESTVTLNGSFSGTISGYQLNESYQAIVLSLRSTTMDSVQGELLTISGKYKGTCLDGWVTFETIEPIFWPESSECPTAGQMVISGNGEATVVFHDDGSVTVTVDGEQLDYVSCEELPPCI